MNEQACRDNYTVCYTSGFARGMRGAWVHGIVREEHHRY